MQPVGDALWWLLFVLWNLLLVVADWRHRRVPNGLVVAGLGLQLLWAGAAALSLAGWHYPPLWPGWAMASAGFLMALLFVPLWIYRIMGAGDVKVIAAYGFLLGPGGLLMVLAMGSLLAGLHGLLYLQASRWWAVSPRLRQVPYAAYLGIAALSVAHMLWNSP